MQKVRRCLSLAVTAALLGGAVAAGGFARAEKVAAAAAADYYAPITETAGDALLGQLHDLITTTHTHYTSYSDCRDKGPLTDPALDGEGGVVEFYTHETIAEFTGSSNAPGTWNREHVWAQSLSNGKWGTDGGGSDLHHLRPSEVKMNATRGNDLYGEVTNGSPVYSQQLGGGNSRLGGYHKGGVFEPLDNVKGDVARIVLYVYTHYNTYANVHGTTNGSGSSGYFGTLPITNIISASSEEAAFSLLVKWNELDPVDAIETTRNEVAYGIQHNRNPFIDHPEYVAAIWGDVAVEPDPQEPIDPNPQEPAEPEEPAENTITITADSFEMQSTAYGFHPWSSGGVEGIAYVFGGEGSVMQFNKNKSSYYLASTTATPGAIRSVTVKWSSDVNHDRTVKEWKLLTSDAAYGEMTGNPTNGTDRGTKTVTVDGVTWQVTGDDTYFALVFEHPGDTGAAYLSEIVIAYEAEAPEQPEEPEEPGTQGGEEPEGPGGEEPGGQEPEEPGGEEPEEPGGETPGGQEPEDPGTEGGETPGGEEPEDPGTQGGETPETPGGDELEEPGTQGGETTPGDSEEQNPGGEEPETGGCKSVIGGAGAAVFTTVVAAAVAVLRRRKR